MSYCPLVIAETAANQTKASCHDKLKSLAGACDKALADKDKALGLADVGLKNCQKFGAQLEKDNDSLREENSKWYRNPFVMFGFGILTGGLTYGILKK